MIFETRNSIYELDQAHSRIRRLAGKTEPSPRQGPDGEWRTYHHISDIAVGLIVIIVWRVRSSDGIVIEGTCTSPVAAIIDATH